VRRVSDRYSGWLLGSALLAAAGVAVAIDGGSGAGLVTMLGASDGSTGVYQLGENVATGEGQGVVSLRDGAVQMEPGTTGSVSGTQGNYQVQLDRGEARATFSEGTDFEIAAGDARITPFSTDRSGPVDARVAVDEQGQVLVKSYEGDLAVAGASGGNVGVVSSGGSASVQIAENGQIQLASLPATSSDDEESGRKGILSHWGTWVGAGVAVVGGGVGAGVALSGGGGSGGDDSSVSSPSSP
jgi:ferric-dicitrate binding protein FerR (iron transport regulator)